MSTNKDVKNNFLTQIEFRFYSYLVQYQLAKYDEEIIGKEVSNNHNSTPPLSTLRIDRVAKQKRKAIAEAEAAYKQKISDELNAKVSEKMEYTIQNEDLTEKKYFNFPPILFALIDRLYTKASSIAQLEFYINDVTWLQRQLIDTIRLPYFSKQLGSSRAKIDNLRSVLGIMGENNLKYFIPKYIIEHNIPKDSSFPLIGRKLFEHSLMTGTAAFHLASLSDNDKINPNVAYTVGLFHEVGAVILFKLYLETFEQVWQEELRKSRDDVDQKRYNTISKVEPCRKHLRKMFFEHSRRFTKSVVRDFTLERTPIQDILTRFCDKNPLNQEGQRDRFSEYVDILEKANIYSESQELFDVKLIEKKHKIQLVHSKNITKEELQMLHSKNLKSLIFS